MPAKTILGRMGAMCLCAAALGGCASAARLAPPPPQFAYTEDFRDRTVLPLLKRTLGDRYRFYDYDAPLIVKRADGTLVFFNAIPLHKGDCGAYDEPPYVTIVVDPRTRAVREVIAQPGE